MKKQTMCCWGGVALIAAAATVIPPLSATAQEEGESTPAADVQQGGEDESAGNSEDASVDSGDASIDAVERPRRGGRGPAGRRERPREDRRDGLQRRGPGGQSPGEGPGPGEQGRPPRVDGGRLFDLFDIDEDDQLSREEFRRMAEAAQIFRHMTGRGPHAAGPHPPRGQLGQRTPGADRPDFPGGRGPRREGPRGDRPPRPQG